MIPPWDHQADYLLQLKQQHQHSHHPLQHKLQHQPADNEILLWQHCHVGWQTNCVVGSAPEDCRSTAKGELVAVTDATWQALYLCWLLPMLGLSLD